MKKTDDTTQSQSERFIKASRELGCDESEERFKKRVKKLASAPPARNEPSKSKKPEPK